MPWTADVNIKHIENVATIFAVDVPESTKKEIEDEKTKKKNRPEYR